MVQNQTKLQFKQVGQTAWELEKLLVGWLHTRAMLIYSVEWQRQRCYSRHTGDHFKTEHQHSAFICINIILFSIVLHGMEYIFMYSLCIQYFTLSLQYKLKAYCKRCRAVEVFHLESLLSASCLRELPPPLQFFLQRQSYAALIFSRVVLEYKFKNMSWQFSPIDHISSK